MAERGARTEERNIGGRVYTVTQMPPTKSWPLQMEMATLLAPLFPALARVKSEGTAEAIATAIGLLGSELSEHLGPERFLEVTQILVDGSYVRTEDGPVIFEQEFIGDHLPYLYPVLGFVLEVNYAKFFTGLGLGLFVQKAQEALKQAPSKESPQT